VVLSEVEGVKAEVIADAGELHDFLEHPLPALGAMRDRAQLLALLQSRGQRGKKGANGELHAGLLTWV